MQKRLPSIALFLLLAVIVVAYVKDFSHSPVTRKVAPPSQEGEVVNIYSGRAMGSVAELLVGFGRQTGIKVNVFVDGTAEVLNRLKREGRYTAGDIFLASDAYSLQQASDELLVRGVRSDVLKAAIPHFLRSENGVWYGLGKRVRVIFYAKERVQPEQLSSYIDLADRKWKGRVVLAEPDTLDNQALVASMIQAHGRLKAIDWLERLAANFASTPEGDDVGQLRALAAGEGDVTIAGSDAYLRLLSSENAEDKEVAAKVGVFFPNQSGRGAHVDISGGAVVTSTMRVESALKVLEFLASDEAQRAYAKAGYEYPVVAGSEAYGVAKEWAEFKVDEESVAGSLQHISDAKQIISQIKWYQAAK